MRILIIWLTIILCTLSCKVNHIPEGDAQFLKKIKINDSKIINPSLDNLKWLYFNPTSLYYDSLKIMGFREFASSDSSCIHLVYKYKEALPTDSVKYHFDDAYAPGNYFQSILKCKSQIVLDWRADSVSFITEIEKELGNADNSKATDNGYSKYYYREIEGKMYEIRVHKSNYVNIEEISMKMKK